MVFLNDITFNSNHSYLLDLEDPNVLSIEKVVNRVMLRYKLSEEKREEYTQLETSLRFDYTDEDWNHPLNGGSNWKMSIKEIHDVVQQKFQELRRTGLLLTKSEFKEKYKDKQFRVVGADRSAKTDLTRLWGANYLRGRLDSIASNKLCAYRVPNTIIVVKDEVTELNIWIGESPHCDNLPELQLIKLEEKQAEILAEFIDGVGCAHEGLTTHHKKLLEIGYSDDGDNRNILRTLDGTMYVVDTEGKSFGYLYSKIDSNIFNYAIDRFKCFAPRGAYKPVLVSLDNITAFI